MERAPPDQGPDGLVRDGCGDAEDLKGCSGTCRIKTLAPSLPAIGGNGALAVILLS